ncbi:unnamed protein product [Durusdinium trenchii]|uniref:DUF4116 domain-containing protein n=1 Tax=Durusdinium trenchii TaxID=1381693 RepID=A0ABP0S655_9DINO
MIRWEVPCFGQRRADLGDQDVSSCNLLGGPIWDHLGGLRFKRWSGSLSHTRPVQPQARASGVPSSARNWNALQYASVELRRDAELCLEAVQQHWRALIHVDDSLWADRDFMLKAIRCRSQCVQFLASDLLEAGDLYLEAVRRDVSALDFADATRRTGMGVGEQPTCRNDVALKWLTPELYQDPKFWLAVVTEIPHGWRLAYEEGPSSLCDNVEVMLEAVKRNVDVLEYGTDRARGRVPRVVYQFMFDRRFRFDRLKQEAVKHSWRAVAPGAPRDGVKKTPRREGGIRAWCSLRVARPHAAKLDEASILKAVEQDWRAISVYLDQLSSLEEIEDVRRLVKSNPDIVRDPRLCGEKIIVLLAVKQAGQVLRHATEHLRDDESVAYAAVAQTLGGTYAAGTWRALEFVSARLKGDEDLVDLAFQQEGLALQHAAPQLRAAPLVVMRAMKRNAAAFHFADPQLHQDTAFWERLSRHFPTAWIRWMRYGRYEDGPSPGFEAKPKAKPKAKAKAKAAAVSEDGKRKVRF